MAQRSAAFETLLGALGYGVYEKGEEVPDDGKTYFRPLDKEDLIILIQGTWPYSMGEAVMLERAGLMEFCGTEWNKDWRWREDALQEMTEKELMDLYQKYKKPEESEQ